MSNYTQYTLLTTQAGYNRLHDSTDVDIIHARIGFQVISMVIETPLSMHQILWMGDIFRLRETEVRQAPPFDSVLRCDEPEVYQISDDSDVLYTSGDEGVDDPFVDSDEDILEIDYIPDLQPISGAQPLEPSFPDSPPQ